jgi:hypothetical protein
MAKKQKRNVASNRPAVHPRSEPVVSAGASPIASPVTSRPAASPAVSRSSYSQEFNPDYHLVIQDLKKIGILAVTFISLLVVLSFFLR